MSNTKEQELHFLKVLFDYDGNSGQGIYIPKQEIKVFSVSDDTELSMKIDSHIKQSDKRSIKVSDIIKM